MSDVRRNGNQLAVVHRTRNPDTKKVEQQTLFTLYSKAEALVAIGSERGQFQHMLEMDNPNMKFN